MECLRSRFFLDWVGMIYVYVWDYGMVERCDTTWREDRLCGLKNHVLLY